VTPFLQRGDVRLLDIDQVFADPSHADISASEVRRAVRAGEPVDDLVPLEVARALQGYTSAR
jgi:nicotinic acid mononucleotide adenylyltransferase